uniref:CTLH domain-containing protein n=1 Tax=Parascaris equorum TaxID=6256 RepID=A0A914R8Z4_PAREQ
LLIGYPDAYIGKARLLEQRCNVNEIRQTLYDLTTKNASFLPGHIEYCRALVMSRDWDKALEQIKRILLIQACCRSLSR